MVGEILQHFVRAGAGKPGHGRACLGRARPCGAGQGMSGHVVTRTLVPGWLGWPGAGLITIRGFYAPAICQHGNCKYFGRNKLWGIFHMM